MRRAALLGGVLLPVTLWSLPLDGWLGAFPAHMLRHMGLVALAAPLLVLGSERLGRAFTLNPLIAAALEFGVVWAWHLPRAHGFAYTSTAGYVIEQAAFLLAGLLTWAGCLRSVHPLAGAGGLLLTSMHMTLLGALLILAPRDLYAEFCGTAPDLSGQQLGGMLMLGIGTPVYLVAGLLLTARVVSEDQRA